MHGKSLLDTNPYLKDPEVSKRLIFTSVTSSSAIEGVHIKPNDTSWAVLTETKKPSTLRPASKSSSGR